MPGLTRLLLAALAMSAMSFAAEAHDPKPRHGGRIVHAGNYHVELVTKGRTIDAFLLGHDDKPIRADGYKGVATLTVHGERLSVPLSSRNGRLTGEAGSDLPDRPAAVVEITNPTGTTVNARFSQSASGSHH